MKNSPFLGLVLALTLASCNRQVAMPAPAILAPPLATNALDTAQPSVETGSVDDLESGQASQRLQQLALTPQLASSSAGTQTSVRADGTLLVGNQPFFPLGFYHVSWASNAAQRASDLNAIANLGFNFMNATMFDAQDDIDAYKALLKSAQSRGMKLMVEDFNDVSIQALKNDPAVLGWMIADDCNNLVTPQELLKRNQHTKALDPGHLTYASMAISYANSHSGYFGKSDAIGNQSYPVDGGDNIGVVYPVMQRLVKESGQMGVLPIANLQSFRWPNGRYPTPVELYSMTNQSLGAGVKGILYYTYLDATNNMNTQGQLRTELKKIATEVKLLAPVLMNGQRETVASNLGTSKATLWTLGSQRYLQVLNLDETKPAAFTTSLPFKAATLTPLFRGRPANLKLQGSSVIGTLAPLAAQWYELR